MAVFFGSYIQKPAQLTIQAFKDRERSNRSEGFEELIVMFNPETYSLSYRNNFVESQPVGASGRSLDYVSSESSNLSLKLILDGTKVSGKKLGQFAETSASDVSKAVDKFLQLTVPGVSTSFVPVATAVPAAEGPRYLRLKWGALGLNCMLSAVTVNYTLFSKQGIPLRAELDAIFIEDKGIKGKVEVAQPKAPAGGGPIKLGISIYQYA